MIAPILDQGAHKLSLLLCLIFKRHAEKLAACSLSRLMGSESIVGCVQASTARAKRRCS